MPINLSALSSPEPDDRTPDEIAGKVEHDDLAENDRDSQTPGTGEEIAQEAQPKRSRRTKAQLIADAVVPADDEAVALKDSGTGAKIERPWLEAVALVKDGKADWVDKGMKHALLKYEQQQAAPAFAQGAPDGAEPASRPLATDASGQMIAPDGAEHGDEVVVGSKTYYVGPGGVLVDGVVDAPARRRWQRELGSGADGAWGSTQLSQGSVTFSGPGGQETLPGTAPAGEMAQAIGNAIATPQNGKADVGVQTLREPADVERVSETTWKVGTGILEKIGLPDYSQLQVGPINVSRMAIDDGRRTTVMVGSRQATIPTAVIEAFQEITDVCEYVARYQRGQLISFLEATGALKQPVA